MPQLANISQRCTEISIFSAILTIIFCGLNLVVSNYSISLTPELESFKITSIPVLYLPSLIKPSELLLQVGPSQPHDVTPHKLFRLNQETLADHNINLNHIYFFISASFSAPTTNVINHLPLSSRVNRSSTTRLYQ